MRKVSIALGALLSVLAITAMGAYNFLITKYFEDFPYRKIMSDLHKYPISEKYGSILVSDSEHKILTILYISIFICGLAAIVFIGIARLIDDISKQKAEKSNTESE